MKLVLVLHLLVGDPIIQLVDPPTCFTVLGAVKQGAKLELLGLDGDKPVIIGAECRPACEHGCV